MRLMIKIDQTDSALALRLGGGQIDSRGRFSDSTLLIDNRNCSHHVNSVSQPGRTVRQADH